jgi:predicted DNA-binding antitoxin AbrB/MazE fold protein
VRTVEARYEEGLLRPTTPLALKPGERVRLIVVRRPEPSRWDLERIAGTAGPEDDALAEAGLDDWVGALHQEDSH